jgi:hypothetical protein
VAQSGTAPDPGTLILESKLGIRGWLVGAMIADILIGPQNESGSNSKASNSGGGGGQKPDTISHEIKFVIVSNGMTPTWKLVNVSANSTGTFFSAGRTRTHDLIITISPNDTQTLYSRLAVQIGQAVSCGNGTLLPATMKLFCCRYFARKRPGRRCRESARLGATEK